MIAFKFDNSEMDAFDKIFQQMAVDSTTKSIERTFYGVSTTWIGRDEYISSFEKEG